MIQPNKIRAATCYHFSAPITMIGIVADFKQAQWQANKNVARYISKQNEAAV